MHSGDLFLELLTIVETGCHSKQSFGVTKLRAYWLNDDDMGQYSLYIQFLFIKLLKKMTS